MIVGCFGHAQVAAFSLFLDVLAMFKRRYFNYFRPFCPC